MNVIWKKDFACRPILNAWKGSQPQPPQQHKQRQQQHWQQQQQQRSYIQCRMTGPTVSLLATQYWIIKPNGILRARFWGSIPQTAETAKRHCNNTLPGNDFWHQHQFHSHVASVFSCVYGRPTREKHKSSYNFDSNAKSIMRYPPFRVSQVYKILKLCPARYFG